MPAESPGEALNRNRIELLWTELQTGFTLAGVAETERSLSDHERADEHAKLSAGLEQLRARLDDLARK